MDRAIPASDERSIQDAINDTIRRVTEAMESYTFSPNASGEDA